MLFIFVEYGFEVGKVLGDVVVEFFDFGNDVYRVVGFLCFEDDFFVVVYGEVVVGLGDYFFGYGEGVVCVGVFMFVGGVGVLVGNYVWKVVEF